MRFGMVMGCGWAEKNVHNFHIVFNKQRRILHNKSPICMTKKQ